MLTVMSSPGVAHRERFRAFPLDGALLFFQPATGRSLRVENERTGGLRRQAPRVAMFGITNRCNLRCEFCSRDTGRTNVWTVETAAGALRGLAAAGTLEVAFGGGEPFTFRGFSELLSELYSTTELALHVTTNGTLLDARSFAPFRGLLGQVRISIYDDARWLVGARTLSDAGQLWGANVLVNEARCDALPALLAELAALGCHDVSVLNYVGADVSLQLTATGRARLAAIISDAPLPCRLSVCFGDGVPVPRLFAGMDGTGDCGAGYDFLSITSDQRVQSCSFQNTSLPARTAEDILAIWRGRQGYLEQATARHGCARTSPLCRTRGARGKVKRLALWRAFSGNNSGECILVGKFESSAAAERYLAELQPGWMPDGLYSSEWQALFENEGLVLTSERESGEVRGQSPSALVAIGKSVLALSYDAGDAFPELRALTWKRAGFVAPGGIHLHESPALLAAIRGSDSADAAKLVADAAMPAGCKSYLHGDVAFVLIPRATSEEGGDLPRCVELLKQRAGRRPIGAELVLDEDFSEADFLAAKQRLGAELPRVPRMMVMFHGGEATAHAARFAESLNEAEAHAAAGCVLIEGLQRRKRVAVLALRQGASVTALDGRELEAQGYFWSSEPPRQRGEKKPEPRVIDNEKLKRELSDSSGQPVQVEAGPNFRGGVIARLTTNDPARALASMVAVATRMGTQINPWLRDVEPYGFLLRRLLADLRD
jgi:MoaA/NifB/PqqE/SkfB family radical SAM enzyme